MTYAPLPDQLRAFVRSRFVSRRGKDGCPMSPYPRPGTWAKTYMTKQRGVSEPVDRAPHGHRAFASHVPATVRAFAVWHTPTYC